MRSYQTLQVIKQAFLIGSAEPAANGTHDWILNPTPEDIMEGLVPMVVSEEWVDKHSDHQGASALVGGYFVVYPDGYRSWSPAEAFESRHEIEVEEPAPGPNEPSLTLTQAQDVVEALTEPRVTKDSIESRIESVRYIHDGTGTFAIIRMVNGFEVNGFSKPASEANFDPDVGERYAYENGFRQLWQLEGYLLCERLTASARWRDELENQLADNVALSNT